MSYKFRGFHHSEFSKCPKSVAGDIHSERQIAVSCFSLHKGKGTMLGGTPWIIEEAYITLSSFDLMHLLGKPSKFGSLE